jgi:hypothetical protein
MFPYATNNQLRTGTDKGLLTLFTMSLTVARSERVRSVLTHAS